MTSMRTMIAALAAIVCMMAVHGAASAQDAYPGRNIRIIVPFSPGTGIDILARTLGARLAERWKTAVIVDNRAGASGNIGTEAAAKSPPDGYAAGVRDVDVDIWYALYVPSGTPAGVTARLNGELSSLLRDADTKETLAKQGLAPTGGTPEELARLTRTELERWLKVVRDARIQTD